MISRLIDMRYEILEQVGEGALFQVYKARDKVLGRVVAVKTLQPSYAGSVDLANTIRRAAAPVMELSHPNIARLYDVAEEGSTPSLVTDYVRHADETAPSAPAAKAGAPFLVTEFVRGINLKERIRRIAPFTLSVAVDFAIATGEALNYAHAHQVVHGDLRPQNVIVSPEGAVKVTDFGLFYVYRQATNGTGAIPDGATPYLAPEVEKGHGPSEAADVYALGAILYEMLTAALPFPGESAGRKQTEPPPSVRSLNTSVPRPLEAIVTRALQPQPEMRYACASDMLNELKAVRDSLRFGKPLAQPPQPAAPAVAPAAPVVAAVPVQSAPASAPEPAPAPASHRPSATSPLPGGRPTGGQAREERMPAATYEDDRISPWLKAALMSVIFIVIAVGIVLTAWWMATFSKPQDAAFPKIVGMKIHDAEDVAKKANVRLIEHDEYNEHTEPGVVFRTDWPENKPIHPGRSVNVWVSKGSKMVWVPNLVGLNKDEADKKIKDNGLTLGEVDRAFNNSVPFDSVAVQNPKAGKRVSRDTWINLIISDGPKPQPEQPAPAQTENPTPSPETSSQPNQTEPNPDTSNPDNLQPRPFNLTVKIKPDGRGTRQVRIEYDDAQGTHTPVAEDHGEGDTVSRTVDVYGDQLTVRVYYGDDQSPVSEKTIRLPARSR